MEGTAVSAAAWHPGVFLDRHWNAGIYPHLSGGGRNVHCLGIQPKNTPEPCIAVL